MGFERREVSGAVLAQTLTANISNSSTSFSVSDGATFPTGETNNFVIVIDRATADEEKILISSRSVNTFTVSSRGYDGTTAVAHTAGAIVDHILDASAVQSMNTAVFDGQILYWMGV
jgi:hypothetical protein